MLLDEATDDGLRGASFFAARRLSKPFSRGEWAGLPLGEVGSCRRRAQTRREQTREPRGPAFRMPLGFVPRWRRPPPDCRRSSRRRSPAPAATKQALTNLRWRLNVGAENGRNVRSASMLAPYRPSSASCCPRGSRLMSCVCPQSENWPRATRKSSGRRRKEQENWKTHHNKASLSLSPCLSVIIKTCLLQTPLPRD